MFQCCKNWLEDIDTKALFCLNGNCSARRYVIEVYDKLYIITLAVPIFCETNIYKFH